MPGVSCRNDTSLVEIWNMDTFSCVGVGSLSHELASVDYGVDFATVDRGHESDAERYEPKDRRTCTMRTGTKRGGKKRVRLS